MNHPQSTLPVWCRQLHVCRPTQDGGLRRRYDERSAPDRCDSESVIKQTDQYSSTSGCSLIDSCLVRGGLHESDRTQQRDHVDFATRKTTPADAPKPPHDTYDKELELQLWGSENGSRHRLVESPLSREYDNCEVQLWLTLARPHHLYRFTAASHDIAPPAKPDACPRPSLGSERTTFCPVEDDTFDGSC